MEKGALNREGYKASDLLDHLPRDSNTLRIEHLMGIKKHCCQLFIERLTDYKKEWLKEMQGSIMVAASLIATSTFQAAINPPGGVWEEPPNSDKSEATPCSAAGPESPCSEKLNFVGSSVMARQLPDGYIRFTKVNSIAFLASVSVIILIVGGFPFKNKACGWLLTMAICIALTFMALSFLYGMILVTTPTPILNKCSNTISCALHVDRIYDITFYVWTGLFALIAVYHTFLFGIRLSTKLQRKKKETAAQDDIESSSLMKSKCRTWSTLIKSKWQTWFASHGTTLNG